MSYFSNNAHVFLLSFLWLLFFSVQSVMAVKKPFTCIWSIIGMKKTETRGNDPLIF